MSEQQELPVSVEFRGLLSVEGFIELASPESLYLLITNELTPDGKRVIIASNLPEAIASKMAMVFVEEMQGVEQNLLSMSTININAGGTVPGH